jgi:hypothetical protein
MVAVERWAAILDAGTCVHCRALHGQLFAQGTGPQPPLHPWCRCRRLFDHWLDVPVPREEEEEENFKQQMISLKWQKGDYHG